MSRHFAFFMLNQADYIPRSVYFLKIVAIYARPISFFAFDFSRTENRVKPKLVFINPKTGSTSILR